MRSKLRRYQGVRLHAAGADLRCHRRDVSTLRDEGDVDELVPALRQAHKRKGAARATVEEEPERTRPPPPANPAGARHHGPGERLPVGMTGADPLSRAPRANLTPINVEEHACPPFRASTWGATARLGKPPALAMPLRRTIWSCTACRSRQRQRQDGHDAGLVEEALRNGVPC